MVEILQHVTSKRPTKISPYFVETRKMSQTRPTLVMEKYVKRFVYESFTVLVS